MRLARSRFFCHFLLQPISLFLGENDEFYYNEKDGDKNSKFISFNLFYKLKIREIPAISEFVRLIFATHSKATIRTFDRQRSNQRVQPFCTDFRNFGEKVSHLCKTASSAERQTQMFDVSPGSFFLLWVFVEISSK